MFQNEVQSLSVYVILLKLTLLLLLLLLSIIHKYTNSMWVFGFCLSSHVEKFMLKNIEK